MIKWFMTDKKKDYKERLLKAFPESLKQDVIVVIDILPLDNYKVKLCDGEIHKVDNLIHSSTITVQLNGKLLTIPYRLYFDEPNKEKEDKLTEKQKVILNCIYLRHHNGFLRQERLERLADSKEYWVIPFTFQLLGEYVFEILEVLEKHINERNIENYIRYKLENPRYFQQTESRMISYWNEYYRRPLFPKLKDYIGKKLIDKIKQQKTTANIIGLKRITPNAKHPVKHCS